MIRQFEELSNNAWPALQTIHYDGWILRFADGVTKRSNSVNMLYPSTLDPGKKVLFCETIYQSLKITPCFKITTVAEPAGIDQLLESRGYRIHSYISFQIKDLTGISADPSPEITVHTELNLEWMDDFIRMNEFDRTRRSTYISIMNQLSLPKCLVSLSHGHQTIGVGMGVVQDNFIGLFDIVVDKSFRNAGLGFHIVENILRWGRQQGADTAYLQVLTDNEPALRLYEKTGFREVYQYWYRMKI